MKKNSLLSQLKDLKPYNSEEQVNKVIDLLAKRNSHIDCFLDKWIINHIGSSTLVNYYKTNSCNLKRVAPSTDAIELLSELLVNLYPVDNTQKIQIIINKLNDKNIPLTQGDFNFVLGYLESKGIKRIWQNQFEELKKISVHIENFETHKVINVDQPFATLLVTGAVESIWADNCDIIPGKEEVYIYAGHYSEKMSNKLRYDTRLFEKYINGLNTGSLSEDDFPENSYIGKIEAEDTINYGQLKVNNPKIFDNPIKVTKFLNPKILSITNRSFSFKHVKLDDRTIKVPIDDDAWIQLQNSEGSTYFCWEEDFNRIISEKSLGDCMKDMTDLEDSEEDDDSTWFNGYAGDEDGLYDVLFLNKRKQMRFKQSCKSAIRKDFKNNTLNNDLIVTLDFDFKKLIYLPERNKSSFDVLQKKEWILDWKCVKFKQGYFVVLPPSDGSVKFQPEAISSPGVLESYNFLKDYLNDRLKPVHCIVEGMKLTIYDKIRLNEAIEKFASISKQRAIKAINETPVKKISPLQMSFKQALSKAQKMSIEDFQKYKSEYINYLVSQQSKKYKIIPCVERLAHSNSDITEYAFLFSIKCQSGDILIVHENVNPDRSTLLFVSKSENYDRSIRAIYDFLQSAEINKRSSLRDRNLEVKKSGVEHYRSINHDYISSWKTIISSYIKRYNNGKVLIY